MSYVLVLFATLSWCNCSCYQKFNFLVVPTHPLKADNTFFIDITDHSMIQRIGKTIIALDVQNPIKQINGYCTMYVHVFMYTLCLVSVCVCLCVVLDSDTSGIFVISFPHPQHLSAMRSAISLIRSSLIHRWAPSPLQLVSQR